MLESAGHRRRSAFVRRNMTESSNPVPEASIAAPSLLLASCLASFAACGACFAAGIRLFSLSAGTTSLSNSAAAAVIVIGLIVGLRWRRLGIGATTQRPLALRQTALAALV